MLGCLIRRSSLLEVLHLGDLLLVEDVVDAFHRDVGLGVGLPVVLGKGVHGVRESGGDYLVLSADLLLLLVGEATTVGAHVVALPGKVEPSVLTLVQKVLLVVVRNVGHVLGVVHHHHLLLLVLKGSGLA
jgi:hypothetical protein